MKYREFGRTGLKVSEIVFGGGWVGGILIHPDDETKRAAVERALEAGINWIDTAPSYGQGQSEEALGWLLAGVEPTPHLSTKVMLESDDLNDIPGQIERSLEQSLTRLRRDSVTLLQLHNRIESAAGDKTVTVDHVLGKGGVADSLERLRAQGLFAHMGITALGEAGAIRTVIDSGRFDSAQVYYNLLNPSAGEAMPAGWSGHDFAGVIAACRQAGVAVMNIRIFAAGVIAGDERTGREVVITEDSTIAEEERRTRAVFEALGGEDSRAQTAIRFALANPDIACVIVGMAALDHLEEAIAAVDKGPLPDEAISRMRELYAGNFGG
jgi:L-galactose dehydrogenase/L-glyceraldehyde 3-phosphate reductase